jgi:putative inorganic carbon (HCO3(-)) transporter
MTPTSRTAEAGAGAAPTLAAAILALPLIAGGLWYVRPALGPWPLLLIGLGLAVQRLTRAARRARLGALEAGVLLFGVTALMGALLAFNPTAAWAKFWVLIGGLGLFGGFAWTPARVRFGSRAFDPVRWTLALLPAALAVYFLLTNDWVRWAGKLPWLDPLMAWLAGWQPQWSTHALHPNVAGGLLAALIPMQMAAVRRSRAGWPLIAVTLIALLLTGSRGAWGALALSLAGWALLARLNNRRMARAWLPLVAALLFLAVAGATLTLTPLGASLAADFGELSRAAAAERLALLHNSLDLALDTPFTGSGLASFQMTFSSYVLLLHVGHTIHSHNLLLNIWIEQGLPGLLIFLGLLALAVKHAIAIWQEESALQRAILLAPLVSLAVIVVHGLVDDAFYGSRGVLLLFAPFALLARTSAVRRSGAAHQRGQPARVAAALGAVALLIALLPQTRAAFQANLGALRQTQIELGIYQWPTWPIQDALRRARAAELAPVMARYAAALALDPHNAAANRRLGQIELSLGRYAAARQHLEAAYAAAPGQRATRQLLGELHAIAGDMTGAAALWQTVDISQGQLQLRVWWYREIGEKETAARVEDYRLRITD